MENYVPASPEEAAIAAALSRPNPLPEAHAHARDCQDELNAFIESSIDTDAIRENTEKLITELDDKWGYVRKNIRIIGNSVRRRSFDYQQVNNDQREKEERGFLSIPESALVEERKAVDEVAMSLGYFALREGIDDSRVVLYHVAKTPTKLTAYNPLYGEMHLSERILIPIDGSVHVELADTDGADRFDLVEAYMGAAFVNDVHNAIHDSESLTDAVRAIGKIDLAPYEYVLNNDKVALSNHMMTYVNEHLKQQLKEAQSVDFEKVSIYEFSGASHIRYYDSEKSKYVSSKINKNRTYMGDIASFVLDIDAQRFGLVALMDFEDGTRRRVIYTINDDLIVNTAPKISIKSK